MGNSQTIAEGIIMASLCTYLSFSAENPSFLSTLFYLNSHCRRRDVDYVDSASSQREAPHEANIEVLAPGANAYHATILDYSYLHCREESWLPACSLRHFLVIIRVWPPKAMKRS